MLYIIIINKCCSIKGGGRLTNPAATYVKKLLEHACSVNASDIHFHPLPNKDKINVYYRIFGKRHFIRSFTNSLFQMILTHLKFTSGMDIGEIRLPQNGILPYTNNMNQSFSLRLSTLPLTDKESMTIRILPQEEQRTLEDLFLFPTQSKKIKSWLSHSSGVILLTGPTGCGKTTTMYSLLESKLKESSFQAITLEDPIEKRLDDVLQVEVNETAGITYQTGLKAALRHDPDILLIGEIRDQQTAEFAFRASLTGHLVLSTLHAKDAKGTIDRLLDLGIDRLELSQTLIAVAAIELLPIEKNGKTSRRAAIVELLEKEVLSQIIQGDEQSVLNKYHSFNYLREKAYLYGFISKEVFEESN